MRLDFRHHDDLAVADEPVRGDLSALAAAGDTLWTANDEFPTVERLVPVDGGGAYGDHRAFALGSLFELPDGPEGEMDIEGLDADGGYLWVVGSHSMTRAKPKPGEHDPAEALARMAELKWQANRAFLGRVPLVPGAADGRFEPSGRADAAGLRPACLKMDDRRAKGGVTRYLRKDAHIAPFLGVPAKENGFDIEGLAVRGERVFLGLRGPVLLGWAMVVELAVKEPEPGRLKPRRIGPDGERYRKHFLQLGGLGVRELAWHGDDLLILAGPTMALSGPSALFRWPGALARGDEAAVVPAGELERVLVLPEGVGEDHPEGVAVVPRGDGEGDEVLVVYDSPAEHRLHENGTSIDADLFGLPPRR